MAYEIDDTRYYPKSFEVLYKDDNFLFTQRDWTIFIPDGRGRGYYECGNFDYHQRVLQKSIKLFGKHLFWWAVRNHRFCYNADNAQYIHACCFGLDFRNDTDEKFQKHDLGKEQVMNMINRSQSLFNL